MYSAVVLAQQVLKSYKMEMMLHSGNFSQEKFLCQILDILDLWGKFLQNGAKWNVAQRGVNNVANRKTMGQKSRILRLGKCPIIKKIVGESLTYVPKNVT